jgi:hypothetical protein
MTRDEIRGQDVVGHEQYEELLAGAALDALEPAEEQRLARHLEKCRSCRHDLTELSDVVADLAAAAAAGPEPEISDELARAMASGRVDSTPAVPEPRLDEPEPAAARAAGPAGQGAPLRRRTRTFPPHRLSRARPSRLLTGAVAAAVVVVAVVAALLVRPSTSGVRLTATESRVEAELSAAMTRGATITQLGGDGKGFVVTQGDHVWLSASGLPADRSRDEHYVVWAVADGHPTAAAAFDVVHPGTTPVDVGTIPGAASIAVVVTREPGRTLPAAPAGPRVLQPTSLPTSLR